MQNILFLCYLRCTRRVHWRLWPQGGWSFDINQEAFNSCTGIFWSLNWEQTQNRCLKMLPKPKLFSTNLASNSVQPQRDAACQRYQAQICLCRYVLISVFFLNNCRVRLQKCARKFLWKRAMQTRWPQKWRVGIHGLMSGDFDVWWFSLAYSLQGMWRSFLPRKRASTCCWVPRRTHVLPNPGIEGWRVYYIAGIL